MPLAREVDVGPGDTVLDGDPAPRHKGAQSQFSVHVCCGQTAGWIKMQLGTEVDLGPGHVVLDGAKLPPPGKGHSSPLFSDHAYCGQTVAHLSDELLLHIAVFYSHFRYLLCLTRVCDILRLKLKVGPT